MCPWICVRARRRRVGTQLREAPREVDIVNSAAVWRRSAHAHAHACVGVGAGGERRRAAASGGERRPAARPGASSTAGTWRRRAAGVAAE